MSDITIKLTDNSDLVKATKDEMIARALEAVGLQAEGNVVPLVPVDTGRLRSSITHVVEGETAYVGTNVEYAPYVEYGTQRSRAQPYLRPGIENHIDEYKAIIERYLKDG